MTITSTLAKLVNAWHGPKLCMIVTGGGIGLCDVAKIPGSSRIIYNIDVPYSAEAQTGLMGKYLDMWTDSAAWKSVSQAAADLYMRASMVRHPRDLFHVSVTAALSTMRLNPETQLREGRKGNNHAYVAFSDGRCYHIKIDKLSEKEVEAIIGFPDMMQTVREREDDKISAAVVSLLLNDPSLMPKWADNESCELL